MRIISKMHDYYDSVQSMGQDRDLVYVRTIREVENDGVGLSCGAASRSYGSNRVDGNERLNVNDYVVGFCGKLYAVLELTKVDINAGTKLTKFCYSQDEVDDFIRSNFKDRYVECYESKNYSRWSNWAWNHRRYNFDKFYKDCEEAKTKFEKKFLNNNCPVFMVHPEQRKVVYNAILKDVEFFRVFDPYMAFQEISMFLSNIAVPQKPVPEISDSDMIEIKGFDPIHSFRKSKSK